MNTQNARSANAYDAQRAFVLETLRMAGPLGVPEIPRGWPVTRAHINGIVNDLAAAGAVRFSWDAAVPGRRRVRITPEGERMLDGAAAEPAGAVAVS